MSKQEDHPDSSSLAFSSLAISATGKGGAAKKQEGAKKNEILEAAFGGAAVGAESFTWDFLPWTIVLTNGSPCIDCAAGTVTKIRAQLTTGGYACVATLSVPINAHKNKIPYPADQNVPTFNITAMNAQGGVLMVLHFNQAIPCGGSTLYYSTSFNPDVYDIWVGSSYGIDAFSPWWNC